MILQCHSRKELGPGDCILFVTDRLYELYNADEVEFCTDQSEEVWAQCGYRSANELADFVFDRQVAFSKRNAPHDDITAVVLRVLPRVL